MGVCSFVERRQNRYYFRVRLPVDIATVLGRTHVVTALRTSDPCQAKIKSAQLFFLLASFFATMRLRMAQLLDIDGSDLCWAEALAMKSFALGQEYEAKKAELKARLDEEFSARWREIVTSIRNDNSLAIPPFMTEAVRFDFHHPGKDAKKPNIPDVATWDMDTSVAHLQTVELVGPGPGLSPSLGWTSLRRAFLADKPGLTRKTVWSYDQAFDFWLGLIGDKPVADIRRTDLKTFADFLRDKESSRGGTLDRKSITRSLGHIKTFMGWAVSAGHVNDDNFGRVVARDKTKEEQFAGDKRRAFTTGELIALFSSPLFMVPGDQEEEADMWFLAIAALSGARTEEIALAPSKIVKVGDIYCLDLTIAGRKSCAAPRLVPLLPDLVEMGLLRWAERQIARGFALVQSDKNRRTAAAWSKRLARYLDLHVSDDPELVLYSLRHSFRQMLRAGNIGDELADKIFGHANGKVGAGYGKELSPDEAKLFATNIKTPIDLRHLWGKR
jgi:integrase